MKRLSIILAIAILFVIVLLLRAVALHVDFIPLQTINRAPVFYPHAIEEKINAYRVDHHLGELVENPKMCSIADMRLKQISTEFSHRQFYEFSKPWVDQFSQPTYIGENLSEGYLDESQVVAAWIASPEHRKNIEAPQYHSTCVLCKGAHCVQIFSSL